MLDRLETLKRPKPQDVTEERLVGRVTICSGRLIAEAQAFRQEKINILVGGPPT